MSAPMCPGPGAAGSDDPTACFFCAFKDHPDSLDKKPVSSMGESGANLVRRKGTLRDKEAECREGRI